MIEYILDRCNANTLIKVPDNKLIVYDTKADAEADLANLEIGQLVSSKDGDYADVFNKLYPIGITYVQYPQSKSPNELWGDLSEWTELDYGGAFFRASGGKANGFATCADTLSSCKQCNKTSKCNLCTSFAGCKCCGTSFIQKFGSSSAPFFSGSAKYSVHPHSEYNDNSVCFCMTPTGSIKLTGDTETRPVNYTVKVWVRTA